MMSSAKQFQEMMRTIRKFQPGLDFAGSLPPEADAHYAGKGVSLARPTSPSSGTAPRTARSTGSSTPISRSVMPTSARSVPVVAAGEGPD